MIPLYRAKQEFSDTYIIGYLSKKQTMYCITMEDDDIAYAIDKNTLSIHLGRKDIHGNKIFESLREDGVGGDNLLLQAIGSFQQPHEKPYEDIAILNSGWQEYPDYEGTLDTNVLEIKGLVELG